MQAVYEILRSLLLYVYGLFAAFFMYAPGDTQQGQDLYSIIRAFLTDPCSIRNGLVGLLLLPSNVYLLGLVLTLAGLFYTGYTLVRMFGRIFMEAFATLAGAIRSVISSLRIGTWGRLGRRGYGGYRGYEGYGDYDDGYGFESQVPGFSSLIFGMSAVFAGAILIAGSREQSQAISGVVTALGSLLSGTFMVVVSGFVQVANTIIATALGANAIPICGP